MGGNAGVCSYYIFTRFPILNRQPDYKPAIVAGFFIIGAD